MISLKIGGIIVAAFIAGAFVASPELRAYAANTVRSIDIVDETIQSVDIKNGQIKTADIGIGQVTNSDLATGAVNSAKIADGTIAYADLSRSFVKVERRSDCNCGGTGWDPDGVKKDHTLEDDAVTLNSVILVSLVSGVPITCSASPIGPGTYFLVSCDQAVPDAVGLNYVIFNKQ